MKTMRVEILGGVQGVGFRYSAQKIADDLGITGWIRNTENGTVEAVVCGDASQIQQFLEWCQKGPVHATVERVHVSEEIEACDAKSFTIRT